MSTIRKRLANIVTTKEVVDRGKVTSTTDTSIYVSSKRGVREFQVPSPGSYNKGDNVKFQGNNFLGRLPSDSSSKVVNV